MVQYGGLDAAEAEVEVPLRYKGARELNRARVATTGESIYGRSSGVAEAEELGGLVKGLSGGVVEALAEHPVLGIACKEKERGVASGDYERDKGELRASILRAFLLQEGRVRVGEDVVNSGKGNPLRVGDPLGKGEADEYGSHEPGPPCYGYPVDGLYLDPGPSYGLFHHGDYHLYVPARGELRHHASVPAVDGVLGGYDGGPDEETVLNHGGGRVVA